MILREFFYSTTIWPLKHRTYGQCAIRIYYECWCFRRNTKTQPWWPIFTEHKKNLFLSLQKIPNLIIYLSGQEIRTFLLKSSFLDDKVRFGLVRGDYYHLFRIWSEMKSFSCRNLRSALIHQTIIMSTFSMVFENHRKVSFNTYCEHWVDKCSLKMPKIVHFENL